MKLNKPVISLIVTATTIKNFICPFQIGRVAAFFLIWASYLYHVPIKYNK